MLFLACLVARPLSSGRFAYVVLVFVSKLFLLFLACLVAVALFS